MIAVVGLAVIGVLVAIVAGLFFLGGKRAKQPQPGQYNSEDAANIASGIGVGATNRKPPRASTGDD